MTAQSILACSECIELTETFTGFGNVIHKVFISGKVVVTRLSDLTYGRIRYLSTISM